MRRLPDTSPLVVECGDCGEQFVTQYPTVGTGLLGLGFAVCPDCGRICETEHEGLWDEEVGDGFFTYAPFLHTRPETTVDANKKNVLGEIGYEVRPCCGLCVNGEFPSPSDDWGTCEVQTYTHLKHTGDPRHLSINKFGNCPKFEADHAKLGRLGAFYEYFKQ